MTTPPKAIQALVLNACLWWEGQGKPVPLFTITWRRSKGYRQSSGRAFTPANGRYHLVVTAGTHRLDQKLVVLHELGHILTGPGHTPTFWDNAWALYRWAKLPMTYCKEREGPYKVEALRAYARSRGKRI